MAHHRAIPAGNGFVVGGAGGLQASEFQFTNVVLTEISVTEKLLTEKLMIEKLSAAQAVVIGGNDTVATRRRAHFLSRAIVCSGLTDCQDEEFFTESKGPRKIDPKLQFGKRMGEGLQIRDFKFSN